MLSITVNESVGQFFSAFYVTPERCKSLEIRSAFSCIYAHNVTASHGEYRSKLKGLLSKQITKIVHNEYRLTRGQLLNVNATKINAMVVLFGVCHIMSDKT